MDESKALLWAFFALGLAFGAAARASRFCLLRGLRQVRGLDADDPLRHAPALRNFVLALAVALLATQGLIWAGQIEEAQLFPVRPRFSPWGMWAGGLLFGVGMALAHSCGARALVLLAGGNLRALFTLLCLGLGAQAAMTGVLSPLRQWAQDWGAISPAHTTLDAWAAQALGPQLARSAIILPALVLLAYALWPRPQAGAQQGPRLWAHRLGATAIGLLVAAGWWISAHWNDPFEPRPLTSLSFVGPVAESLLYLQMAVGRPAGPPLAMVAGVLLGAGLLAQVQRTARWEGFARPADMLRSALGGLLMGLGGVLALGCSIGQGLAGLATLSLASVPAAAGIALGALLVFQCGPIRRQAPG